MSLRIYHDVTLAANDAAIYTMYIMFTMREKVRTCHRTLILTVIPLKSLQINLEIMSIQKIEQ